MKHKKQFTNEEKQKIIDLYVKEKKRIKIYWTKENVKLVEIVIINKDEAWQLFKQAISEQRLVLDKIIIKYNQYEICVD